MKLAISYTLRTCPALPWHPPHPDAAAGQWNQRRKYLKTPAPQHKPMEILSRNKGVIRAKITAPEDLWHLTYLIDKGDLVTGQTFRKINLGGEGEKAKVTKRPAMVKIMVEKIDYDPSVLRINGTITEASDEEIPKGSHQSLALEQNTVFTLEKETVYSFQEEKLKEMTEPTDERVLLVIHDRESALFVALKRHRAETLLELHGQVQKKDADTQTSDFYAELARATEEQMGRRHFSTLVIASPSFFKEYLIKKLPQDLKDMAVPATCSSVSENAVQEILKRGEIKAALARQRMAEEAVIIDELFKTIMQDGAACYGLAEVATAAEAGAVRQLLIADKLIEELRKADQYEQLDEIMKATERAEGKVMIVSTAHEDGERLYHLGGIAALLRYRMK